MSDDLTTLVAMFDRAKVSHTVEARFDGGAIECVVLIVNGCEFVFDRNNSLATPVAMLDRALVPHAVVTDMLKALAALTNDQRVMVYDFLNVNFCRGCGEAEPPQCHCDNHE